MSESEGPDLIVLKCLLMGCGEDTAKTGLLVERRLCASHAAQALVWFNSAEGVGHHPNEGSDILHWVVRVAKTALKKERAVLLLDNMIDCNPFDNVPPDLAERMLLGKQKNMHIVEEEIQELEEALYLLRKKQVASAITHEWLVQAAKGEK